MDFAKNILHKYGWREGEGLGKNSDGIAKPIKASFKFNSAGLGADQAKDLTNNWWERVYNEASENLDVGPGGRITQKDADGVEISDKSYSVKKLKQKTADGQANYGSFLKASRLITATGQEQDLEGHVTTDDIQFKKAKVLTDEELFAACGGRTAHKGARHGLNLSGKLARIEEQNAKLMQQLESTSFEAVIKSNDWQQVQGRKKSKKKKHNKEKWNERHGEEEEDELKDMVSNANYVVKKSKKKAKADRKVECKLVDELDTAMGMFDNLPEEDGVEPDPGPSIEEELDLLSEKIRRLDHSSIVIKKKKKDKKIKSKKIKDLALDKDEGMDPAAKYRKDYRADQKQNNKLLQLVVPHEVPPEKKYKPKKLLKSDSEASENEDKDVVERINEFREKMKSKIPKIKISQAIEEEDEQLLAEKFKEKHKNQAKRIGKHRKRSKKKKQERHIAKLADKLGDRL
ncbi:G patch domain-containing protein 4 [Uranotaenia lowii]|uniref:G patch domain-containing protein 4 n=1 Tax=Uranotaenia lowii TaxID=190385 RepID=UPI00247A531C|nr:G patch domain-containing protein 4 [Uranotaenia lowii]